MQTMHHYQNMLDHYQNVLKYWNERRTSLIQKPLVVRGHEVAAYLPPQGFPYLTDRVRELPAFILVNDNCDGYWSDWVKWHFPWAEWHASQELYDWVEEARKEVNEL